MEAESTTGSAGPVLTDLATPSTRPAVALARPSLSPKQSIYFYSPDEWEEFILEWATALPDRYVQIKRLGGSGDGGIDIAAFRDHQQLEGDWDCFQGKHYERPLQFAGDAAPEILKVFLHVLSDSYVMPARYGFVAPRGCGKDLDRLLSKPNELRSKFVALLEEDKPLAKGLEPRTRLAVIDLAKQTDFSRFHSLQLHEVLEAHSQTRYYAARFGQPIPTPPPVGEIPADLGEHETRYVAQLRDVYREQDKTMAQEGVAIGEHPRFGKHFKRQRFSFYSAESLMMNTRDAVPTGTFEALQDDILSGVIDISDRPHASGLDRLSAVLAQTAALNLNAHALISVSRLDDLKGVCHQLVNDERLSWLEGL